MNLEAIKDHGEGGLWVTKALQAGHRALVVDDIYTSGTAKREAFQLIRAAGACPVGVLVVVNRTLETDSPNLDGIPIYWLTSLTQIGGNDETVRRLRETC